MLGTKSRYPSTLSVAVSVYLQHQDPEDGDIRERCDVKVQFPDSGEMF
jgi:hypothetical protein